MFIIGEMSTYLVLHLSYVSRLFSKPARKNENKQHYIVLRKLFVYLNEFTVCTVQTLNFKAKSIGLQTNTYLPGDRSIILPKIGSFFKYRVFFQVFQSFSRVGPQTLVVRTSLKRIHKWNRLNIMAIKDFTFYTEDKVAKCSPAIFAQMAWKEHVIADLR